MNPHRNAVKKESTLLGDSKILFSFEVASNSVHIKCKKEVNVWNGQLDLEFSGDINFTSITHLDKAAKTAHNLNGVLCWNNCTIFD